MRPMRKSFLFPALLGLPSALLAQQAPAAAPAPYTLRVQSRLIVEDVTVLDRKGNAVTGLPASAFQVLDDGKPQTVQSFQEISGAPVNQPGAPMPAGTFSNSSLFNNRGTVVVLLIDPNTIHFEDQMYLRVQALKFIDRLAPGTSLSVFRVDRSGVPVLLQPLTQDKALLRTAITAAMPRYTQTSSNALNNAVAELQNISDYLRNVPGRKAVFWLAGAFPLYQSPGNDQGGGAGSSNGGLQEAAEQKSFRALEAARISVYPVDVRGVQMGGMTGVGVVDRGPTVTPGYGGAKPTSESERVAGQYDAMDSLAQATGGQAFYSNNNVSGILAKALKITSDGYTLSYHPAGREDDGKWHRVQIHLVGPYTVRFREGYYAPDAKQAPPALSSSRHPLADGAGADAPDSSVAAAPPPALDGSSGESASDKPIVFNAHVVSEPGPARTRELRIRYVIPTDQLTFEGSGNHAHFKLAALLYDTEGNIQGHVMDTIDIHYTADQMKLARSIGAPVEQTIPLGKGAQYLLLAVVDPQADKTGVVQIPLAQIPTASTEPAHP